MGKPLVVGSNRSRKRSNRRIPKHEATSVLRPEGKPIDARVRRTRNNLRDALIILSLEMDYTSITIRDITTEADVGYATFFRHYRDKDELLVDVLDYSLDGMMQYISPAFESDTPGMLGRLLFEYIAEDPELYVVLLRNRFRLKLIERAVEECIAIAKALGTEVDPENLDTKMAYHHLGASIISLIEWWFSNNMEQPPEEIGAFFHKVVGAPINDYLRPADSTAE